MQFNFSMITGIKSCSYLVEFIGNPVSLSFKHT